jgi:PadR family transcriptional regulator, regulatory protein PadR
MLGVFEQAVLLAVVRLGDDAYGRMILKEVEARLQKSVSGGAIQATLARLERKGLLLSRLGPGTEVRAGRPRRFYRLGAPGLRALEEAHLAVHSLWRGYKPRKGYA